MTTLSFDIFARTAAASKEFDQFSKHVNKSSKDVTDFGAKATASFEKTASGLTGMVKAAGKAQGAEESIAKAQRAALDAQVNLTSAREKAATQMRDLEMAAKGAGLAEQSAILQLAKARQKLSEASKFGDGLDMADAELGVQRAQFAVDKAKDSYAQLSAESERASRVGVDGADQVVAAQKRLADAQRGVRNAHKAASDDFSKGIRKNIQDASDFGDRAAMAFLKTANSLSNIPTAAAGLAGVGQILGGLSGVLGLLPAAAAAAGAAFGTLAVGVAGFADGMKAFGDSSKIQKAATASADGAEQAARRIQSAEQSLARAQRNSEDAQVSLTRAREDAKEKLQDLQLALRGASLSEEDAAIGLERARQRLAEARNQGASGLDLREAELGVRQAALAVDDAKERFQDLSAEATKATKAGVEGSDEVVAAQRQVADAAQQVRDAQVEVAQAHADAAKAAAKGTAALGGTTEAFDKLGKNAQDTIRALFSLGGAWTDLKHSVSDALFAGVADQVKGLGGTYIPVLKTGMTGIAGEFNKAAMSLGDFLKEGQQVKTIQTIFGSSKDVTGQFTQALKPLVSILLDVAAVGSEILPSLTGGFGKAAEGAAAFVKNARETGELKAWIERGLGTLNKLGDLFGNIGAIVHAVFAGLNAGGKNFLDTMISVTDKIRAFLESFEGQQALKALGEALSAVSKVVTEVMITAFEELAPIIVKLAPGFAEMARLIGSVLVDALTIAGPLLAALAGFISDNIDWLGPLALALYAGVKAFEAIRIAVIAFNLVSAMNPWVVIIAATIALAILIATHWDQIMSVISAAWEWIQRTAVTAWEHIKSAIIDPIVDAVNWVGRLIGNIIDFFRGIPRGIGDALSSLGGIIEAAFKGGLNLAIQALNWGIQRINDLIYGVNLVNPFDNIPYIPFVPRLHTGGVVPGAPGSESLYMLQAGETVLPASWEPAKAPAMSTPPSIPTTPWPAMSGGRDVTLRFSGSGLLLEAVQAALTDGSLVVVGR